MADTACPMPRPQTVTRDLDAWFTTTLDVRDASRCEIIVPLFAEYEKAALLFEHWPAPVRAQTQIYLREFVDKNPTRAIVAITHGVSDDSAGRPCCVTIVHHKAK